MTINSWVLFSKTTIQGNMPFIHPVHNMNDSLTSCINLVWYINFGVGFLENSLILGYGFIRQNGTPPWSAYWSNPPPGVLTLLAISNYGHELWEKHTFQIAWKTDIHFAAPLQLMLKPLRNCRSAARSLNNVERGVINDGTIDCEYVWNHSVHDCCLPREFIW